MNSANAIKGLVNDALNDLERVKAALDYLVGSSNLEGEIATATHYLKSAKASISEIVNHLIAEG